MFQPLHWAIIRSDLMMAHGKGRNM